MTRAGPSVGRMLLSTVMLIGLVGCGASKPGAPIPYARITDIRAAPESHSGGQPYWTNTWYNVYVHFRFADGHTDWGVAYWSVLTPEIVEIEIPCGSRACSTLRILGTREGRAYIVAAWNNDYGSWVDTAHVDFVSPDSASAP